MTSCGSDGCDGCDGGLSRRDRVLIPLIIFGGFALFAGVLAVGYVVGYGPFIIIGLAVGTIVLYTFAYRTAVPIWVMTGIMLAVLAVLQSVTIILVGGGP